MSEYQYYEFRALDKPLSAKQQDELRNMSTRAEITSRSFTNEYHWGDFRGDPRRMMRDYFDAHLYYANWGTHNLAFRLPAGVLDTGQAEAYVTEDELTLEPHRGHLVVWFTANVEEADWDEVFAELDDLEPIRDELMAGDLRPLYLSWLAAIARRYNDDPLPEPPVSPGLGKLTPAQKALAKFLWLDDDLLTVAARDSGTAVPTAPGPDEFAAWLKKLRSGDKDDWLVRLATDESFATRQALLQKFRSATRQPAAISPGRRTSADLLAAATEHRHKRERKSAAARQRKRDAELDTLAQRGETAWRDVERLLAEKKGKSYDEAMRLLRELSAVATRKGTEAEFLRRVQQMRTAHARKPALIDRFNRAGWK